MRVPPVALLAAAMPLLAGCVDPAGVPGDGAAPAPSPRDEVLSVLRGLAPPRLDAVAAVDEWETFNTLHPKRDWPTPTNSLAAEYLSHELAAAGFRVEVLTFPFEYVEALPVSGTTVRVIRGTLDGADPGHRFALVAHYDGELKTTQAAYDDGAGTIAQLQICRLLALEKARLRHSVECLFFDAEENGLVASRAYAQWYNETPDRGFAYDLVFGYDMTGINWPGHDWRLYAMVGTQHPDLEELTEPFHDFLDLALHAFLADGVLPGAESGIEILDVHDRNSDEQSFKRIGIPVVRFAGGRKAADYPMYHQPGDTVPYVYQFVGGRANFEKGFDAVIRSSYYTVLGYDAFDPWRLPTA